ncbi:MAG: low molecular weight phosphotyrosine protein phosphatase [Acetobacter sp.]|nr:low molecular weight phosphotyrosine protein phosphatase [Bacteroides sp.]MCM1341615.1 low molecular weight phosphotyrosine protein phosphatase [Acetobacter sp.]MCM1434064.1 low molecular weight phosphotyrosine protein phosphatase [Clostridiales bacterium]
MIKIMFVCHGNICRSPMAEFIFKDMLKKQGIDSFFIVSSSATSTEEIFNGVGNPVYPPAKRELAKHGLLCNDKRAVKMQKSDYDKYDYFIGMDSENIRNMNFIFDGDKDNKISKLMDYTDCGGDVADPWYSRRFDIAYRDIYEGCAGLIEKLCDKEFDLKYKSSNLIDRSIPYNNAV